MNSRSRRRIRCTVCVLAASACVAFLAVRCADEGPAGTGNPVPANGVFAELVVSRTIVNVGIPGFSAVISSDQVVAHLDSAVAPGDPVWPMEGATVSCNAYTLSWQPSIELYRYANATDLEFLALGATYTFSITEASGFRALSQTIDFPDCAPVVTSPENTDTVHRSGFDIAWANFFCGGTVRIALVSESGDSVLAVETANDGAFSLGSSQLGALSAGACTVVLTKENARTFSQTGYDPRSAAAARVVNTTQIVLQ